MKKTRSKHVYWFPVSFTVKTFGFFVLNRSFIEFKKFEDGTQLMQQAQLQAKNKNYEEESELLDKSQQHMVHSIKCKYIILCFFTDHTVHVFCMQKLFR